MSGTIKFVYYLVLNYLQPYCEPVAQLLLEKSIYENPPIQALTAGGTGNGSFTFTLARSVPDAGSTLTLLGITLGGLGFIRRS